ncbi:hypothetical protein BDF22DRAFT_674656 [Syncephalis plumigaleata]|nr:hypothetical protein BDF22DRAFT_674656 [Syncephalis plumigaleata]
MRLSILVASLCIVASVMSVQADLALFNNDNARQQVLSTGNVKKPAVESAGEERRKYIIMFKQPEVNAQNFESTVSALESQGVTVDDRLTSLNGAIVRMTQAKYLQLEKDDNIEVIEEDKEVHIPESKNYY